MKKLWTTITAMVMTAALAGCGAAGESASDVKTVRVGTMNVSERTSFIDDNGDLTGFEIELLKLIDEKLPDYQFEFVQLDGPALFSSLDAGKVDMVNANFRRSDAREANYIHTYRAYTYTPYRIVVPEENTEIQSIEDLAGKKVGIGEGSLMATIMEAYVKETGAAIELVYVTDNVSDLLSGRIDATVVPQRTVDAWNDSYQDVSFKAVGDPVVGKDGCMKDSNAYWWFAKGSEELRNVISDALYELREEGKVSELALKWYGIDYPAQIDLECEQEVMEMYGL